MYARLAQFMVWYVGSAINGKKLMTKTRDRKATERILINRPEWPSLNEDVGSGCRRSLRNVTQKIEIPYELSRAPTPRELI